jgi:ParB family chromosome partitioning protein
VDRQQTAHQANEEPAHTPEGHRAGTDSPKGTTIMTATPITVEQIDPAALLADVNIRTHASLDKDFLASIKELGVLVPIVAVRVEAGLRVRYGHRRTLAAVEAGHATVPVVVVGDGNADSADEIARIVSQWHENEQRAGLSTSDKLAAVEQLSLLGLSAGQIVKRTRARKVEVEQAMAASASPLARGAAQRYDFLTLDAAAGVAEFEDQPDTVKVLVAAARKGEVDFEHVLQRARDARIEANEIAALTEQATAAGVRVVARPEYGDTTVRPLDELATATGDNLTPKAHSGCPGHVAFIRTGWRTEIVYACAEWKAQGHRDRFGTRRPVAGTMDEAAKAERQTVIANNKAWRSATAVRRQFLTKLLARKTPPAGTSGFVAGELARGTHQLRRAMERTPELIPSLLGLDPSNDRHAVANAIQTAAEGRAQVMGLAVVLAAIEDSTDSHTWRQPDSVFARYFTFLTDNGYALSDVEQIAAAMSPTPRRTRAGKPVVTGDATGDADAVESDAA